MAAYLGRPYEEVAAWPIASDAALRIIGDPEAFYREPLSEERLTRIYATYPDLHLGQYLKTLMYTSLFGRAYELFDLLAVVRAGERVLDFGSGVGTHAILFLQAGCRVDLLDVNGPLLDFAKYRIEQRGLTPQAILPHDAPLERNRYDVILCTDVLEHMLYPVQAVKRLIAALRGGGILHVVMSDKHVETGGHIRAAQDDWTIHHGQALLETQLESLNRYNYRKPDDR